jgi:hypothetical protein
MILYLDLFHAAGQLELGSVCYVFSPHVGPGETEAREDLFRGRMI